jgi:hypothetical protein
LASLNGEWKERQVARPTRRALLPQVALQKVECPAVDRFAVERPLAAVLAAQELCLVSGFDLVARPASHSQQGESVWAQGPLVFLMLGPWTVLLAPSLRALQPQAESPPADSLLAAALGDQSADVLSPVAPPPEQRRVQVRSVPLPEDESVLLPAQQVPPQEWAQQGAAP